jgi:hypothetical protein
VPIVSLHDSFTDSCSITRMPATMTTEMCGERARERDRTCV